MLYLISRSRPICLIVILFCFHLLIPQMAEVSAATKKNSSSSKKSSSSSSKKSSSSSKAKPEAPTTYTLETLPRALESAVNNYSSSRWGVEVLMLETGQELFSTNPEEQFIPASNRKIFTGALALDQLGPDFRFNTYLYRSGRIDASGALQGDLIILPQGDPTFNNRMFKNATVDWVFRKWVEQVQAAGIKSVQGRLIVDCSRWDLNDMNPRGWAENVKQDYYAPQTSALTINENVFQIKVNPGAKDGDKARIEFVPPADGYPIINNAVTSSKNTALRVRKNSQGLIEVSGNIHLKATTKSYGMPIDRPTLFASCVFRHHLQKAGIPIHGQLQIITSRGTLPAPSAENTIAMYPSPPLSEIVKVMMKRSVNHFAEQIYVAISAVKLGRGGYTHTMQLEHDLLRRAGINPQHVEISDGSGLSRTNFVAPRDVCTLLAYMRSHPYGQEFFDSMAIAGRDGTLRNRLNSNGVKERVFAKTGYIRGVSALSGYFLLAPDRTIIFSFLINEIPGSTGGVKATQDKMLTMLSNLKL